MTIDGRTIATLTDLVVFLMWLQRHDPNAIWGGRRVEEAVTGLSHLSGIPVEKMREIAFGKEKENV